MVDLTLEKQATEAVSAQDSAAAFSPLYDNGAALDELLAKMEASSESQADKGTRFEQMVLDYLAHDSVMSAYFDKVQLYADWAVEHPEYASSTKDYGIDLMATLSDVGKSTFGDEDVENEAAAVLKTNTAIKDAHGGGGVIAIFYTLIKQSLILSHS